MQITSSTRKYRKYNEDGLLIKDNLFFVFDGATDLSNNKYEESSPASEFVSFIIKELSNAKINSSNELENAFKDIICAYKKDNKFTAVASAGACGALIINNKIKFYSIGDCDAIVKFKDKTELLWKHNKLKELDQKVLDRILQLKKKDQNLKIMDNQEIVEMLRVNRNLMNKPNGYKILSSDISPTQISFRTKEFDLKDIEGFVLVTDGFFQIFEPLHLMTEFNEIFITSKSLDEWNDKILAVQLEDSKIIKYNRFKLTDDSTIIRVVFD